MRLSLCFTRASCDIQIRQLINDIKCACPLAHCVLLSHCATVINIRILLKASSIFTSHIFLDKRIVLTTEFIIVLT